MTTAGLKVISAQGRDLDGIDVSSLQTGMYVVAIVKHDGTVYYEKVLKD